MRTRGFTMVELLTVIAMIAILASILFPVFARARENARRASCASNLFNIGLSLRLYAADHDGGYPPVNDDLTPLLGKYTIDKRVFICPSAPDTVPMGAPANPKLELGDGKGTGGMMPGASPKGPPPSPAPPPGMSGGPPGGAAPGAPGEPPGGPLPPPPAPPPDATKGPSAAAYWQDAIFTGYRYHAGRRHNELPRTALCTDQDTNHNEGANVLYSDGGIKWLPKAQWLTLGFTPLEAIRQARNPTPHGPESKAGPG